MINYRALFIRVISTLTISCLLLTSYSLLPTSYFLLPAPYPTILAQEPNYDRINEIAKNLNCPTCSGLNLADCRTQTCEQWRSQINDLIKQGYSNEEIVNYFTTHFGEQVLQKPPAKGWTLYLWVLPVAALLLGGTLLVLALREWIKSKPAATAPASSSLKPARQNSNVSSDYLSQVEKDLNTQEW